MDTLGLLGRVRIEDLPEDVGWPRHEIIDGSLLVSPLAGLAHQRVVGLLQVALARSAPAEVIVYPAANLRRTVDGESDLLIPDVVVAQAGAGDGTYLAPDDVLLVIEVVSPSTRTTDTVTKRATYAAWGIPAYLVVDPSTSSTQWHGDTSALAWAVEAVADVATG